MSFLVLGQESPESFLVVINDINLEATVTNRSNVAAAWINGTKHIDGRRLIVGISTTDKYGTIPPQISPTPQNRSPSSNNFLRRHPNFFDNLADPPTSFPAKTKGGSLKPPAISKKSETQLAATLSESMASVGSSPPASAPDSSIFLPSEIKEIDTPSFPSSSTPRTLFNPKAPIHPSSGNIATLQLCCGNRCLVFSLLYNDGGIPDALVNFLFDRDQVTLVGAGVRRSGDWLGRPDPMLVYVDPWELGEARAWRGLRRLTTLDQLAGKLLGREKAIRLQQVRYWDRWPLSENQMAVACLDAYLLSQIGEKLLEITPEAFPVGFFFSGVWN
ncbi:hypothetical protein KFK09_011412 [Dendrobium nobile]|uniref:Uncharacterized protein n=1 Tax=Dendrobium nobile TaxID=94219 RepID=A0A8T3BEJ1_DENNO|nr:hypothetical protein KFK09_011412 [Dendrobium nobile]